MKKLSVMAVALCFVFASCNKKQDVVAIETPVEEPQQEEQVNPEMAAAKAMCEAWHNWDQQTQDKKIELIADRKAKITKMEACKAKKAEFESQKTEFEKTWTDKWTNFDNLEIEEQKALIDNYMKFNRPECCNKGEHHEHHEACNENTEEK